MNALFFRQHKIILCKIITNKKILFLWTIRLPVACTVCNLWTKCDWHNSRGLKRNKQHSSSGCLNLIFKRLISYFLILSIPFQVFTWNFCHMGEENYRKTLRVRSRSLTFNDVWASYWVHYGTRKGASAGAWYRERARRNDHKLYVVLLSLKHRFVLRVLLKSAAFVYSILDEHSLLYIVQ